MTKKDSSSPFKGEGGWGMGDGAEEKNPIPTPALPLKGREFRVVLRRHQSSPR